MIIRMVYVLPMILGRTFDFGKSSVGVDIFSPAEVEAPRINPESSYSSTFTIIDTSSDLKKFMAINGDLSIKIKNGLLDVGGVGAYVKSVSQVQNSVDILVKVSFRTVSKSLHHSARPMANWATQASRQYLGTHFVQTVIYGGDLIACIRFKAVHVEDLQHIRGTIEESVSAGNAVDLIGGQQLEALDKKLQRKATMEISYFATVPLEGVPNTIEGLRDLVKQFKSHVKKVNNGLGVPVEVELAELAIFDTKFRYLKNSELETELEFFEECLDDLIITKTQLHSWLQELPGKLSPDDERKIVKFSQRMNAIRRLFSSTIGKLDLEKGSIQLKDALDAYKETNSYLTSGKFRRELNKTLKKITSNMELPYQHSSVYTHYGSSDCTDDKVSSTSLLHVGYLASSPRNHLGAGYNYLCMPKNPDFGDEMKIQGKNSTLAGVKYGLLHPSPFYIRDDGSILKGAVCAVCLVRRQTVFSFFGQSVCPSDQSGWRLLYSGYLMAGSDIKRSENVCVDSKLESHQDSYMGRNDQSLNFVLAKRVNGTAFVQCAVCSK